MGIPKDGRSIVNEIAFLEHDENNIKEVLDALKGNIEILLANNPPEKHQFLRRIEYEKTFSIFDHRKNAEFELAVRRNPKGVVSNYMPFALVNKENTGLGKTPIDIVRLKYFRLEMHRFTGLSLNDFINRPYADIQQDIIDVEAIVKADNDSANALRKQIEQLRTENELLRNPRKER